MKRQLLGRAVVSAVAVLLALSGFGCSKKAGIHSLIPNERPKVDLTAAPVDSRDTSFYAYRVNWSGTDPDGKVDRFQYAIDPPTAANSETLWVSTTKNEQIVFFRATTPYRAKNDWRAADFHTFVIRAVDNLGLVSIPKSRSFYSYTIAPSVAIVNPPPSAIGTALVTPAVRITWNGFDPDGQFTQKPVKYKYKLLRAGDPEFDINLAKSDPDSLRRFYAKSNFAGWDSTSADTTFKQYTGLTPNAEYLFIVIGYDEAGAYSPDFSLNSNILDLVVGFAGTLGPQFTVFNEFLFYQYTSGGFTPNDPLSWIELEVPAQRKVTFNWFADPPAGAAIEWYRWKLDGDVTDETSRTNEDTDWYHWSQKSNLTTNCVIGPFAGGETHFLYVEAQDNTGIVSLATVHFKSIAPTFDGPDGKNLLIVDDTRLEPDINNNTGTAFRAYARDWPAAAELDTFLYARGNVPWRKFGNTTYAQSTLPGVFAGYDFDTLGTRLGYEIASRGTPLSLLSKYKHVIWMVDLYGGKNLQGPTDNGSPMSNLTYMSTPGRSNSLAAYQVAGGKVWLLGGAAGFASTFPFNARGNKNNDFLYGPGHTIFSNSAGELVPGRLIYSGAHWQSEMDAAVISTRVDTVTQSRYSWSQPGWNFRNALTAPNYSKLPAPLRFRSLALGDTLPPTRLSRDLGPFYNQSPSFVCEYLDRENIVEENVSSQPGVSSVDFVLDSLYRFKGGTLVTQQTGQIPVCMTYYHGVQAPEFVYSGFDIWSWTRSDCISLVDFVMQEIWHLPRVNIPRSINSNAALRAGTSVRPPSPLPATRTLPLRTVKARLPVGRTGE